MKEFLPSEQEQSHLIRFVAELISLRGRKTFLQSTILLPTDEFFPDTWTPDENGVRLLARRLLQYVDLGKLAVNVKIFENPEQIQQFNPTEKPTSSHHGTAAWYAGMPDGVCQFGAETNQLKQAEAIVGAMCHEVAHAYREYHQLVNWEHDVEERLTDITTIYLGFGVLTANASYRYRSQTIKEGFRDTSQSAHYRMGYLSAQSMCFLLAMQVVARGLSAPQQKLIANHLEPNQKKYFLSAAQLLGKDREALLQRLGLETKEQAPLPATPVLATKGQFNLFLPVFRVTQSRATSLGLLGFLVGGLLALSLYFALYSVALSVPIVLVFCLLGAWVGHKKQREICSDPTCGAELPARVASCPQCGGNISGTLSSQSKHIKAVRSHLQKMNQTSLPN